MSGIWEWLTQLVLAQGLSRGCSRGQLGLLSSEGLTRAGVSASKVTHSQAWQVNVGFWLEALVPCHVDLTIKLLEYPYNMAAGLPQSK